MNGLCRIRRGGSVLSLGLVCLAGCASEHAASNVPRPKDGINEYRQIVAYSRKAVTAALQILERVSAATNRCPPALLREFSRETDRLQADSVRVRARAQAMEQRGDAYFEKWEEHLAQVKDPEVRRLAQERRPELEQSFGRIKASAQRTRAVFRPFLADLRRLRGALENDPGSLGSATTQGLIRTAQDDGRRVQEGLAAIQDELNHLTGLLQVMKPAPRN